MLFLLAIVSILQPVLGMLWAFRRCFAAWAYINFASAIVCCICGCCTTTRSSTESAFRLGLGLVNKRNRHNSYHVCYEHGWSTHLLPPPPPPPPHTHLPGTIVLFHTHTNIPPTHTPHLHAPPTPPSFTFTCAHHLPISPSTSPHPHTHISLTAQGPPLREQLLKTRFSKFPVGELLRELVFD